MRIDTGIIKTFQRSNDLPPKHLYGAEGLSGAIRPITAVTARMAVPRFFKQPLPTSQIPSDRVVLQQITFLRGQSREAGTDIFQKFFRIPAAGNVFIHAAKKGWQ